MPILSAVDITITHRSSKALLIQNVSFSLESGERLGIVGESGSGKTLLCKALLRVLPPQFKVSGEAFFDGTSIFAASEHDLQHIRGCGISMIPQDAGTAYVPLFTLGTQIIGTLREKLNVPKKQAFILACEALSALRIEDPASLLQKYPHQLSGGMLQRCMIATTLALSPRIIIADEPTTALDVLAQKEVVDQLDQVRERTGAAMIFISHDLGLVHALAESILVLKNGEIVEYGAAADIIHEPRQEYTRFLLRARKMIGQADPEDNFNA